MGLVRYVNLLVDGGYGDDSLPDAYHDLYALDRFIGQVNNGGVKQFIANSRAQGVEVPDLFTRALRATRMIRLPALEAIVQEAMDWTIQHPKEALQVTATSGPATLSALDRRVYRLKMTRAAFATFLENISDQARAWILEREEPHTDAAALKAARIALEELPKKGPHNAARYAADATADAIRINVEASGRHPDDDKREEWIKTKLNVLPSYIVMSLQKEHDDPEEALFGVIQREITEGFGLSRESYVLHAAAWLLDHPNLSIVENDNYEDAVSQVLQNSPFAAIEAAARKLDRVRNAIPGDSEIAIGQALPRPGLGLFGAPAMLESLPYDLDGGLTARANEGISLKTTQGRIVARRQGDTILVHRTSKPASSANKQKKAKALIRQGKTQEALAVMTSDGPAKPGRVIGRAKRDPELRTLALSLGLAEVLAMVTDATPQEQERHIFIGRGRLDKFDKAKRRMTWRFPFPDAVLHVSLSLDGADVRSGEQGTPRHFTPAQIADYRTAHSRDR